MREFVRPLAALSSIAALAAFVAVLSADGALAQVKPRRRSNLP